MRKYIIQRLLQLIPILIGITLLSFFLLHTTSTDTVDMLERNSGGVMSEEAKQEARRELGLDQPLWRQYIRWLGGVLTGDMGTSHVSGEPVFSSFLSKLPATMYLALASILVTLLFSVPLGILSAVKQNTVIDYIIQLFSFIGNSMPNFFVSLLLLYIFSVKLKLLPVMGIEAGWKSIILPTLTLAISMTAKYTRQIQTVILEEMQKEYVLGARARGVGEIKILLFHILRVSLITIITLLALSIGSLLGGTAIVESIFMWDGVGKMAVDAIMMRDYPVIQVYVIWMAIIYVVVNLIADFFYYFLDPRIRREEMK